MKFNVTVMDGGMDGGREGSGCAHYSSKKIIVHAKVQWTTYNVHVHTIIHTAWMDSKEWAGMFKGIFP
jgi:hypothetical protein